MTPPRLPGEMPARTDAVLRPVIAFQLAWMPPLPVTRGTSLRSGVSTGTSILAAGSRSKKVRPAVGELLSAKVLLAKRPAKAGSSIGDCCAALKAAKVFWVVAVIGVLLS